MKIGMLDIGVFNTGSIKNMLSKFGVSCEILHEPNSFTYLSKLIVPRVGSFDPGMKKLPSKSFFDKLNDFILNKNIPILDLCLGPQLLGIRCEERFPSGLRWIHVR